MYKRWKFCFIILIILSLNISPCLAETIYFQSFENSNVLDSFDIIIPNDVSLSFTDQNVFDGESSLHMVSTNPSEHVWIQIPLSISFVPNIIISINHYFIEGIPFYWVVLRGNTENETNVKVNMEYGNPGPYWHTNEIVFIGEFGISLSQWNYYEIDLTDDVNTILNTPGKPWESFEPTIIESFIIGMNPVWEPYKQRNVYFDNFEVRTPDGNFPPQPSSQYSDQSNNHVIYNENSDLTNLHFIIFGLSLMALILIMINTVHYVRKH